MSHKKKSRARLNDVQILSLEKDKFKLSYEFYTMSKKIGRYNNSFAAYLHDMDPPPTESLNEMGNNLDKYLDHYDPDKKKNPEQKSYEKMSRKRDERIQYPGHACPCCKVQLDDEELKLRLKNVSIHRGMSLPKTPYHYSKLEFPDDEECIKRGYMEPQRPYYFITSRFKYG